MTEDENETRVVSKIKQTFGENPIPLKPAQIARVAISSYRSHLREAGLAIVPRETLRKSSVAIGLTLSLDADDDSDQWQDARAKMREARELIAAAEKEG